MKYKLAEYKNVNGVTLHQLVALKDFGDVKCGDKGGWIQHGGNLSQDGLCWVWPDGVVYGNACVMNNAFVKGFGAISDSAVAQDDACIMGRAIVREQAHIGGCAVVKDNAIISGVAKILGSALIATNARIADSVVIMGHSHICGDAVLGGTGVCDGASLVCGHTRLFGHWALKNQHCRNNDISPLQHRHTTAKCDKESPIRELVKSPPLTTPLTVPLAVPVILSANEYIDQIEHIRKSNNKHWVKFVRLAFELAPDRAKMILKDITNGDKKISEVCQQMVNMDNRNI